MLWMDGSRKQAAEFIRIDPKFTLERLAKVLRYKNPVYKERNLEALRNAGLT
jgi:hypothetical protein